MNDKTSVASPPRSDCDYSDFTLDCESRAYRQFSLKMDRELRKLVAEWAHLAAPIAAGTKRRFAAFKPTPK